MLTVINKLKNFRIQKINAINQKLQICCIAEKKYKRLSPKVQVIIQILLEENKPKLSFQ
jgi:hypothetical protein